MLAQSFILYLYVEINHKRIRALNCVERQLWGGEANGDL